MVAGEARSVNQQIEKRDTKETKCDKGTIKDDVLKGHGLSRATTARKRPWALAPEGIPLNLKHLSEPKPLIDAFFL